MTDQRASSASERISESIEERTSTPGWSIIAGQELRQLWGGGRGLLILLGFSIFLSIFTYLLATSEDLTRMTQTEMISLILQISVTGGILLVLVLSTDSFSGERDRSTMETLLLTPIPRRHIAIGKFIAALSLWAGLLLLSLPYLALPARGTGLFGHSVALGVFTGTILIVTFYFLGTIFSTFSHSNLMSFTLSLFAFFVLFAPMQLPGGVQNSSIGKTILRIDPVSAGINYMTETLANGGNWGHEWNLMVGPIIIMIVIIFLGLSVVDRFLNLPGGGRALCLEICPWLGRVLSSELRLGGCGSHMG